jgi:peptidoglycan-associated lipoprotein
VEGNCDERGSREYNLALGQRRADSIKRVLTLLGVPGTQINTVSLGSEKPVSDGGSETDLAKNRRSDLVYPGLATTK